MTGIDFIVRPEWRFAARLTDEDRKFLAEAGIAVETETSAEGQQRNT
jgi:hypothetical protein